MKNQISPVNGVIISDCTDANSIGRQQVRFASLFGNPPSYIRLTSTATDLEAAGNLVDVLDAANSVPVSIHTSRQIVLVNVAPRGDGVKEKWDNGTPFCYFISGNTIVVSTFDGRVLALARDIGLVSEVKLLDIPTVTSALCDKSILTPVEEEKINNTQFRSNPKKRHW